MHLPLLLLHCFNIHKDKILFANMTLWGFFKNLEVLEETLVVQEEAV